MNSVFLILGGQGDHEDLQVICFERINTEATNVIYIYGAHILDVSRSHTTTQHSR